MKHETNPVRRTKINMHVHVYNIVLAHVPQTFGLQLNYSTLFALYGSHTLDNASTGDLICLQKWLRSIVDVDFCFCCVCVCV